VCLGSLLRDKFVKVSLHFSNYMQEVNCDCNAACRVLLLLLLLLITCIRLISSRVGSARKCSVSKATHTSYSYKLLQLVTQSANESHQ
jgi:hypothetical protein